MIFLPTWLTKKFTCFLNSDLKPPGYPAGVSQLISSTCASLDSSATGLIIVKQSLSLNHLTMAYLILFFLRASAVNNSESERHSSKYYLDVFPSKSR